MEARRVWSTDLKDLKGLNHGTEGKLVTGVWIIFLRQRGGHEQFKVIIKTVAFVI